MNDKMELEVIACLAYLLAGLLLTGASDCQDALGLKKLTPDHQFHASSWTPGQSDPWYGRLGNQSKKSWCSSTQDANQFIQIDFGPRRQRFTGVSSQGSHTSDAWVTAYSLSYSDDGSTWSVYTEGGTEKVFTGNADRYSPVNHSLLEPIVARFVRFHPKTWNGELCMRVEAFGCSEFYKALGVEDGRIKNEKMKCRQALSSQYAHYARLNHAYGVRMYNSYLEFLEINIGGSLKVVTAVATQGSTTRDEWVKQYTLSYSANGADWFNYTEHGEIKMFDANTDRNTIVKHGLRHDVTAILIRFNVYTAYSSYIGMRVEVYGGEVCNTSVGIENSLIPDSQISASASAGSGNEPEKGRLNGAGAWCGVTNLDFLQIDLGKVYKIQKLAIKGHPGRAEWVTKFAFHYSLDNMYWYLYGPEEGIKELVGNKDQSTVVYIELNRARQVRYARFQPKTWNTGPCMRIELYGCLDCMDALGLELGHIPDSSMSASSTYDVDHEPWLGRLYESRGEMAWCAKTNDGNQYLEVDLGHITRVTGIATQGKYSRSWWAIKEPAWVTAYKMSYSNLTFNWTFYKEDGVNDKVFAGNTASRDIVKHNLTREIVARHVRFIPSTWQTWTCMRVEVYGCQVDYPLGMEFFHIKREAIIGSAGRSLQSSPYNGMPRAARLNIDKHHGWSIREDIEIRFLQIDLGSERVKVTAVATQGHSTEAYRQILKFTLAFSSNLLDWFDYREMWETKILDARKVGFLATKKYLQYPVTTRHIRFYVKKTTKSPSLRVEVYGIRGCSKSLLESNQVKAFTVANISSVSWTKKTKLNDVNPENTWCGDTGKFLRFDFSTIKDIRTLFLQGHPTEQKWVKTFGLRYSNDGFFYTNYTSYRGQEFPANVERLNITKIDLGLVGPRLAARFLEIHPLTWNTAPCMRIEIYGDNDCSEPLGMADHRIEDKDIKATSWITVDKSSSLARLHNIYGEGAWCPRVSDTNQYLEINLNNVHRITGIATQGRYPLPDCLADDYWVTQYSLEYSTDTYTWQYYQEKNIKKVFPGNQDHLSVAVNHVSNPFTAKILRIRPELWNRGICMRVEIYGCRANARPIGMEDYRIPKENMFSKRRNNGKFRLNHPYMIDNIHADCLGDHDGFLSISLGYIPYKITRLAKQCTQSRLECVTRFSVSFSLHDGEWFDYQENGVTKAFYDDFLVDSASIRLYDLKYEVKAKYVRVISLRHFVKPCLQFEIYGYQVDNVPLGLSNGGIPDSSITASSQETGYEAINGRLDSTFTKAWCAAAPVKNGYLKIDVGRVVIVTQIAVGRLTDGKGRVVEFWLSYSVDGKLWDVYNEGPSGRKDFKLFDDDISRTNEASLFTLKFAFRARFVRIRPTTFVGQAPCLTVELYGKEDCKDELGLSDWRVPNKAIKASSYISNNYSPWMGRVGNIDFGGAWCARNNDVNQFLQIDLGSAHKITRVNIQGKERVTKLPTITEAWVKSFSLSSSKDGYNWTEFKENSAVKVFEGNTNKYEVNKVNLSTPISGRFIRVHPKTWQNHICMRVELVGCEECGLPLGMENWKISKGAIQTSAYHWNIPSFRARLKYREHNNFCLGKPKAGEFLYIDLGPAKMAVSAVAVQGRATGGSHFVTKFSLQYSKDGINHATFLENGQKKIFAGPLGDYEIVKYRFGYTMVLRSVRVVVEAFHLSPCFNVELYGCNEKMFSNDTVNEKLYLQIDNELKLNISTQGSSKSCGHHILTGYTLSASTELSSHTADKADMSILSSAWCATTSDSTPYLQATFGSLTVITQIVTMGHPVTGEYVKQYELIYSDNGSNWITYYQDNEDFLSSKEIKRDASKMEAFVHTLQYALETKHVRIMVAKVTGELCLKVAFYGYETCKDGIGFEDRIIPDSAITASSSLSINHSPGFARLNHHLGHGAWCSGVQSAGQYLQVDLNRSHKVDRLALQAKLKSVGSGDGEAWVKGFTLKSSQDGNNWVDYKVSGSVKSFKGITNKLETAQYDLNPTLVGRFVRIVVSSWQNRICLRMELYGCKACGDPLGIANFRIPDSKFTGSTYNAHVGRLTLNRFRWYTPNEAHPLIYWQVDLGSAKHITGIATSGRRGVYNGYIKAYTVECSLDDSTWTPYKENANTKLFPGAKEGYILRHDFTDKMTCRYVRLVVKDWELDIALAAELYGCSP